MFILQYLNEAKDDIRYINKYIAQKSGYKSRGREFTKKLLAKCETLADSPFLQGTARPELRPDIRSISYGNYVIFFRHIEEGDILQIVRIIEGHRNLNAQFDDE